MDPEDSDQSDFEPEGLLCAAVTKKKSPYFRRRCDILIQLAKNLASYFQW